MVENDEVSGSESADTPYVPTGSRRSTFTPPSGKYPPLFGHKAAPAETTAADAVHSDDDLAGALAEQLSRYTGSVPVVNTPEQAAGTPAEPMSAPVELPDRPKRRSLQDDELVRTVTLDVQKPDNTLDAIERLQAELQLREQEAREFTAWEHRMRTIGTPEALESIAEAIPEFTGVIPIIPMPSEIDRATPPIVPVSPVPETAPPEPASPQPVPPAQETGDPEPFLHPEQFPPPRLEERVDVGELQEPNLSDDLVFLPPWMSVSQEDPAEVMATSGETVPAGETVPEVAVADTGDAPETEAEAEPLAEAQVEAADGVEAAPTSDSPGAAVLYELVDPTASQPALQSERGPVDLPESSPVTPAEPQTDVREEPQADALTDAPNGVSTSVPAEPELPLSVEPEPDSMPLPFDALLAGNPEHAADGADARPFSLLYTPPEAEPTPTGSHEVIIPVVDSEPDADVDETDRAFGDLVGVFPVTSEGVVLVPPATGSAPIQPVSSPRIPTGEQLIADGESVSPPLFSFELSSDEATPVELRTGRAVRMFWLWFATNSSLVSVAFGAALFGLGMSLRQAILAAFIGVAVSFLPLGLGTLAGKWSGQPTIVVSRATFGLVGNIVPAILTLVTRLFWGAVLLWLVGVCTARILVGASLGGPFDEVQLSYLAAVVGFVLAFLVALFGYHLFARVQLILSAASGLLIVGLFIVTWSKVDVRAALTVGDGPWILVVTGVVLVFSFIGLVWANSSGDLARYQRPSGSGATASLWASFGATLPAFLLIAYGALLAASNPDTARGLLAAPLDTLAVMIPSWYPVPLLAATIVSLLSGVALSLYSGGFALRAAGLRLSRPWSIVVIGAVLLAITVLIILSGAGIGDVFRDLATSLAVPIAAWAGIFAAEVMIRRRRFDEESLLKPGGIYPTVNWVNLTMLVVASAVGFAFTSATVSWLSWQGYGFALFGFPIHGEVAASDIGVLVALVLGLLTPLAVGISTVRQQESASR